MEAVLKELEALQSELKSFGPDAHWFCPKRDDADYIDYDSPEVEEDGISTSDKQKLINEAGQRKAVAYQFCLVFAFSAEDMGEFQQAHRSRLTHLFTTCDRCVRNYHMGRRQFLKNLSERFEDHIVEGLSERINQMDFSRIEDGLQTALGLLELVPETSRSMKILQVDQTTIVSLYEALCCAPFHSADSNLSTSFDIVFKSVQLNKPLKLKDILPAMAQFLFDSDQYRHRFAINAWKINDRTLTPQIFEWAVQDSLIDAIKHVSMLNTPVEDAHRFWEGLLLILNKHDKALITHALRGMEVQPDIYHLALQHLAQYDSQEILDLIIRVVLVLLTKSPQDFWDACGSISPATVAEQFLNNRAFYRSLSGPKIYEPIEDTEMPSALAWISTFLQSLPPAQQYEPCRLILHHLFERSPEESRLVCFRAGLDALLKMLMTFTDGKFTIDVSTSFIVISNSLGLVGKYKDTLVACGNSTSSLEDHKEVAMLAMSIIRNALSLHCKFLQAEYQALASERSVHHGMNNEALPIWHTILDSLNSNHSEMARNVLIGITPLIGLEKFKQHYVKDSNGKHVLVALSTSKVNFNDDFGRLTEIVSRFLERLSDFNPIDIRRLCETENTAYPLFGALTPPDQEMYEAAVEVFKTITGQSGRKEAISETLHYSLRLTLSSLAYATRRISKYRTFAALPYFIKTSRDVLDSLCDSQDGILRIRSSPTHTEQQAIITWWSSQWQEINIAFGSTEQWSVVNDKVKMTNFCRDAMEYAEALFDQYSVLATVLTNKSSEEGESSKISRKNLLEQPRKSMDGISRWLRLKDQYLLMTVVSLVSKILRRLGEFDMEVEADAFKRIENVAKTVTKTNLTPQQKSELSRALEEHQGVQIIEMPKAVPKKHQGTIDTWSRSANGAINEPTRTSRGVSSESTSTTSDDYRTLTQSLEQNKAVLEQMKARQPGKPASVVSVRTGSTGPSLKERRQKEKEEKKKRDAVAVAHANALRNPSGVVAGEGSGLKGIGVTGKDHTPIRGEIMVSSDEESSEDNSDLKAIIAKGRDGSRKVQEYEEGRRVALQKMQQNVPVRKVKIARSKADMRARLVPPMEPLHTTILSWDIFYEGEDPPSGGECQEVSNTFQSTNAYKDTFQPLLISEAWRSFLTAKEENNFKPFEIKIVNRVSTDHFIDVSTTIPIAASRESNIMEGDIVLFSKGQDPIRDRQEKHCLARVHQIKRKKDVVEIQYRILGRGVDPTLLSALSPKLTIRGLKITSMTTIEREYAALSSLKFYDLCEEILSARPSPILQYSDESVVPVKRIYGLNTAQAKAIRSAKENDAFTLIQGPPGSGKTKTIVAMVGALLSNNFAAVAGTIMNRPGAGPIRASSPQLKKKLLVCAPSNAAVDELVVRLKEGVKTLNGEYRRLNVIRLGRSEAINSSVKDVTLDELVRIRLEGDGKNGKLVVSEREKLHLDAAKLKDELGILRPKLEEARTSGDKELERRLQREFDVKKRDQARIGARIDENKDSGNTAARENEIHRRKVQQEIIDEAHVLCATLSGSGHDMFRNLSVEFETVIIDEAAQSIELAALIPLKYGCSKCILVGDPKQLPPTVLSRSAARYGYEQSLFVRMQQNHPASVHLLDTQYRMHPEISLFPSTQFYDSKLVNGENMAQIRHKEWHSSKLLGPYRFFDVKGTQTSGARGHSFINIEELNVALQLYHRLRTDYKSYDFRGKVGIITPYKAQLLELRARFQEKYGEGILDDIDFNTTDAFQGREAEVIIFSCVRARASGGIGFLEDIRRMNVGLTRAKSSLFVLGDSRSLLQGEFWAKLINDAKSRQTYTEGNIMNLLRQPTTDARKADSSTPSHVQKVRAELEPSTVFNPPTAPKSFATSSRAPLNSIDHRQYASMSSSNHAVSVPEVEMSDAPELPEYNRPTLLAPKLEKSHSKHGNHGSERIETPLHPPDLRVMAGSDKNSQRNEQEAASAAATSAHMPRTSNSPTSTGGLPRRPLGMVRKRPAADPLRRPPPKRPAK